MERDLRESSLSEQLPEHIFTRIHEDIGQASMCWDSPEKAGVFHSEEASVIVFNLCQFISDELTKKEVNEMSMDEVERSMEIPEDIVPGAIIRTGKPLPKDPWIHRSDTMLCRTCMYFVPKQVTPVKLGTIEIGRCRRCAPTMKGFPIVFPTDWCGDHRLDENKV
jgi:hypothetical protein